MKLLFFIVLIIFAVFGLSEFLHILKMKYHKDISFKKLNIIVVLCNDDAEKQLIYIGEQYRWYGLKIFSRLVFDTRKLDKEKYEKCKKIAVDYGFEI